jgi:hypothetical protein
MNPVEILEERSHGKASEVYINVKFTYGKAVYDWDVPIVYRRTGLDLSEKPKEEIEAYLNQVYELCNPKHWSTYRSEQKAYWATKSAVVTKPFFDVLVSDFGWKSAESDFPANNNPARRIQDLKDQGYTIATRTKMWDEKLKKNCTHLMLLPIPRGGATGYESWSPKLKDRIITLLNGIDVYENRKIKRDHLIIDHKFPEIRWDTSTLRDNLEDLTDEEILHDFQLIDNQRNQQKREVCRNCFQTDERGSPFGVEFYYAGQKNWESSIPKQGKKAEAGCIGCGWYDLAEWRHSLQKRINKL